MASERIVPGALGLAQLRRFGGEVAAGHEKVDWVATPRLAE